MGQQSVSGECLMIAFYCSRRSRSSKLSFCSPQGTRAAAVGIHSALCFYTREEVGQAHSHRNVFTGGWALSAHHNIVVLPFCAGERGACESRQTGRHLCRVWRWSNSLFGMIQQWPYVCEWMCMRVNCYRQNRPPLGPQIRCLSSCTPHVLNSHTKPTSKSFWKKCFGARLNIRGVLLSYYRPH